MFKMEVFYRDGQILEAKSPLNQWEARDFTKKFEADKDVILVVAHAVEKLDAQAMCRAAAEEWKQTDAQEGRSSDFHTVAAHSYIQHVRIGTSG